MSIRNLGAVFKPQSIAIIGASAEPGSLGQIVHANLRSGGFRGPVYPVNPKHACVDGLVAYPSVKALPCAPDLAVVLTPPDAVAGVIGECGDRGCRGAVVITAGFGEGGREEGTIRRTAVLGAAKPHLLRIVGPNCLGAIVPGIGLNASFARTMPAPGSLALVTQSGAIAAALIDWASTRGIGFSHVVSLGDMIDVDFGDMLDYLASDPGTHGILLYIEGVTQARKFISAARAASRLKPVIAIKSGRSAAGAKVTASHTGALAGSDAVYTAAFQRAGVLRVDGLEDLFESASLLASGAKVAGDRLGIITNGGGLGALAADRLIAEKGRLAALSSRTMSRLDAALPPTWSHGNPVDLVGDAAASKYLAAISAMLAEPEADALLVMHCPTAAIDPAEIANVVAEHAPSKSVLLTAWVGGASVGPARDRLARARIPHFDTPEAAVDGFMHLSRYKKLQDLLQEVPAAAIEISTPATAHVRRTLDSYTVAGWLSPRDARTVLSRYGIPCNRLAEVETVDGAVAIAASWNCAVALKIRSPDIIHKSDVGGVALNLRPGQVAEAAQVMLQQVAASSPKAKIDGFTVEEMVFRPDAQELLLGMVKDDTFGPTVTFGHGGAAVEVIDDKALGLPPLNLTLADAMIASTRVGRLLAGYRNRPRADLPTIAQALVNLGQLISDFPAIVELDINPLLADQAGIVALDARIKVDPCNIALATSIEPYPRELESRTLVGGAPLTIRAVRPQDEAAVAGFIRGLTPEDRRFRFFSTREPAGGAAKLTQVDYDRELALVALRDGEAAVCGLASFYSDPDRVEAEFAIAVRSDQQGNGIGTALMANLIEAARKRGIGALWGPVMKDNTRMLMLCRRLGMEMTEDRDECVTRVSLGRGH